MKVELYDDSSIAFGIIIIFWKNSKLKYRLDYCTTTKVDFPVTVTPLDQENVWTISKDSTHIEMECNGVIVFDISFTDCSTSGWSRTVERISFSNEDSASDGYRNVKTGKFQTAE